MYGVIKINHLTGRLLLKIYFSYNTLKCNSVGLLWASGIYLTSVNIGFSLWHRSCISQI